MKATTKKWIRNRSDELAAENGCRFNLSRARHAVDWIERHCRLYEGEWAGQPLKLRDWQHEVVMRIFGWEKYSQDWKRWVRRFRTGSVWVPKKNKKSPTLAAVGLYLLCGDGEQGQKVFSCAKDGKQAMIAQQHAIQMVRRSPALTRECRINKTTGRIAHTPTGSFLSVMSGDNIEGQEGLNGCLLVDETHVVDARLMRVTEYMGISRSEPLHLEFSTAGNNPEGYGKTQFDLGTKIAAGERVQEDFFFQSYGAPQDISDQDLDARIEEIGKAANPAWGHTIKPTEFLDSYQKAKRSISAMLDFRMYRLNIWQRSSNPWIKQSDWTACRRDFKAEDLHGHQCRSGFDLSLSQDFTAWSLLFDQADCIKMLAFLWMSEKYARENNHLAPFLDWAAAGHIKLTPGAVVDQKIIRADIVEQCRNFRVETFHYDEAYAEPLRQDLINDDGVSFEPVKFKQNLMTFAKPTEDLENLIIAHKFHHNGNPAVDWQFGHCEVYRDANGNKRPMKPDGKQQSVKKIDVVIATCEALAGWTPFVESEFDGKIFTIG